MSTRNRHPSNHLISFTPIGGVGEIGSNMTLVETQGESIVLDVGILFPDDDFFDLKYLIPNMDYIEKEPSKLIITHGHQDHIGAVSHFVERFPDVEIFAPPFSAELLRNQFKERKINTRIKIYKEDDFFEFEHFRIHPIHVNHSIPETYGMLFKHNEDQVAAFFVSDFKVDDRSPYERYFDFEKLKRLSAHCKERILLADSTNILSNGFSASEADLLPDIEKAIVDTKGIAYVTLFSSNIHRVQSIIDVCKKTNKALTFVGRSIYKYTDAAIKTHHLHNLESVFVNDDHAKGFSENLVVLLTGCQGDFFGALKRLACRELNSFKLKEGDRVIFSSKIIPGNEKKVFNIYNEITSQGIDIVSARDLEIHASGHACKEELSKLAEEYKPTQYIPIHGETFFLRRHCELINERFPQIKTHFIQNFSTIRMTEQLKIDIEVRDELSPEFIHGKYLKIAKEKISERRKMATRGMVFVSVRKEKKFLNFQISMKGLPKVAEDQQDNLRLHLKGQCKVNSSEEEIEENVRVYSKRFLSEILGYRPEVMTHIIG